MVMIVAIGVIGASTPAYAQTPPPPTQMHTVTLNWNASTVSCTPTPCTPLPVTGYNVYRATNSGMQNFSTPLNGTVPLTNTTFIDTTVFDNQTYYYKVKGRDTEGEGGASAELQVAVGAAKVVNVVGPPSTITVIINNR